MSDKTEQPTARRLQRARRDGDVTKSAHLSTALGSLFWWLLLASQAPHLYTLLVSMAETVLSVDQSRAFAWQIKVVLEALVEPVRTALIMTGFGVMAAIVPELAQTRGLVSFKRIAFDFQRVNPVRGLANLFGLKALFDFVLLIIQFAILIDVARREIAAWLGLAASSYALAPAAQLALIAHAHTHLLAFVALSQLAPAAADYAVQHRLRLRRLRMDRQEVKREFRDEEGDPLTKSRHRSLHRNMNP